ENDKVAQQLEIVKLKARVKKLEKLNKIKSSKLRRLKKVLSMQEDDTKVREAVEVVTTVKLMTEVVTATATQVPAASTPIRAAKPKTLTITVAPAVSTRRRKRVEHEEAYKNIDWNAALDHVQSKEPQKLSEEAQEADDLKKRLENVQDEDDDVFVEATPLAQKLLGLMLLKRSKENTKCVSAANEELTAAKHK
nr:hypothetical protein [Tanacetum cinerariifolium]